MRAFMRGSNSPDAQTVPMAPPIDVPTQCTRPSRSSSHSALAMRA